MFNMHLKKQYPSITQEKYNEIMRQTTQKNESHKDNPLATNQFFDSTKIKGAVDFVEHERINRLKFGVKKPANVWYHEMDDNRITADQIRTSNFRGSIHERDA